MLALNSLHGLDEKTTGRVLAAAAFASSPMAEIEADDELQGKALKVIEEARAKLRIDPRDYSVRAQAKLDEFLSSALTEIVPDVSTDDVLKSRGAAGKLPPSMYKVEVPRSFLQTFRNLAVREKAVVEAISRPTDHQHQLVADLPDDQANMFSLFLKRVDHPKYPHWLLVHTTRVDATLVVQSAWRVLPDVVDLSGAKDCLGVLNAFVEQFGVEVEIAGKRSKFIDRITLIKPPEGEPLKFDVTILAPTGSEVFSSWSHVYNTRNEKLSTVGFAYAIDLTRYRQSLIEHGMG